MSGTPTESSDLLAVLDQLDLDALPNGRVGLLSLNTDLLENDALGVGGTTERRGLEGSSEQTLLVVQVRPLVVAAVVGQLARGVQTTGLSFTHLGGLYESRLRLLELRGYIFEERIGEGVNIPYPTLTNRKIAKGRMGMVVESRGRREAVKVQKLCASALISQRSLSESRDYG